MAAVLFTLVSDGKALGSGLSQEQAKALFMETQAKFIETGARVPYMKIVRETEAQVAGDAVVIDDAKLKGALANFGAEDRLRQAAWRKFQSAAPIQRAEMFKHACETLANDPAYSRFAVLAKALAGESLSSNQIRFLVGQSAVAEAGRVGEE